MDGADILRRYDATKTAYDSPLFNRNGAGLFGTSAGGPGQAARFVQPPGRMLVADPMVHFTHKNHFSPQQPQPPQPPQPQQPQPPQPPQPQPPQQPQPQQPSQPEAPQPAAEPADEGGGLLRTVGYAIPGVGSALSAQDAYNSFRKGNFWTGLGHTALAGLGLIPGFGLLGGGAKAVGRGAAAVARTLTPAGQLVKTVPRAAEMLNAATRVGNTAANVANWADKTKMLIPGANFLSGGKSLLGNQARNMGLHLGIQGAGAVGDYVQGNGEYASADPAQQASGEYYPGAYGPQQQWHHGDPRLLMGVSAMPQAYSPLASLNHMFGLVPSSNYRPNGLEQFTRAVAQPWSPFTDRLFGQMLPYENYKYGSDNYQYGADKMTLAQQLALAASGREKRAIRLPWGSILRGGAKLLGLGTLGAGAMEGVNMIRRGGVGAADYRDQQAAHWANPNPVTGALSAFGNAAMNPIRNTMNWLGVGEKPGSGGFDWQGGSYNPATGKWEGASRVFNPGKALTQHLENVNSSLGNLKDFVRKNPIDGMTEDQMLRHYADKMGFGHLLAKPTAPAASTPAAAAPSAKPDLFRYYSY